MKIINCLNSVKGTITRLSLILCLGFCLNFSSFSNPISEPPAILEVYFNYDDFFLEMLIEGDDNLDNMRITGLYDTAQFMPGINFTPGEVFYVNKYDFGTEMYINPEGDFLTLEIYYGGYWSEHDWYGFGFGNIPWSEVTAPIGEESVAYQRFYDGYENYSYWTVKELPNSLGESPFQVSKRAEFSGYVRDKNDMPLAGIKVHYAPSLYFYYGYTPHVPEIFTDENGYFHTDNMFCKKYYISFLFEEGEIGDTSISVEPDSANYFEFKLDTLLTGIGEYKSSVTNYSISNIPNPFSNNTTFVIEVTGRISHQKGIIKIYNSEGYIINILPIEISGEKQELPYNPAEKSLANGIYYYSLEIGNEKKASGKMVISR